MTSAEAKSASVAAARKPASLRERLGILGVGLAGNQVIVLAFDYTLYPFVMWRLGLVWGCLIMTALSFIVCYATLLFYDWAKKDWLGIEAIKAVRDEENGGRFARWMGALLRRSEGLALVVLSVKFDPFIVTAYLRRGSYQFDGLTRRDWRVFVTSLVIANAYWSFVAFAGVSVVAWVWQRI